MHYWQISWGEYADHESGMVMHKTNFSREEFIKMYNVVVKEVNKEVEIKKKEMNRNYYHINHNDIIAKMCEKFGFETPKVEFNLWARDEVFHPVVNEEDIKGEDDIIDVSDQEIDSDAEEPQEPQARILMQFKIGNVYYPVIGTQDSLTQNDIRYALEHGTKTKVDMYLDVVKVEVTTPDHYHLEFTMLRECIQIDSFVKQVRNGDVRGAMLEMTARNLAKAADEEFLELVKKNELS